MNLKFIRLKVFNIFTSKDMLINHYPHTFFEILISNLFLFEYQLFIIGFLPELWVGMMVAKSHLSQFMRSLNTLWASLLKLKLYKQASL